MSDSTTQPGLPSGVPPPGGHRPTLLWIAVGVLSVVALVLGVTLGTTLYKMRHLKGAGVVAGTPAGKNGKKAGTGEPSRLARPEVPGAPAVVLTVRDPAKVKGALQSNEWLGHALSEPVGRGLVGAWAGFLGTRGEDVSASFTGTVLDYVTGKLLANPFQVVWFSGSATHSQPAIVMHADGGTSGAWSAVDAVAKSGEITADGCPLSPEEKKKLDAAGTPAVAGGDKSPTATPAAPADSIHISRWVLAGESVYSGQHGDQIAIARNPSAVLYGVCLAADNAKPTPGADLEVAFSPAGVGREAELFTDLLGVARPRLAFAAKDNKLEAIGISADKASAEALDVVPLPEEMLAVIPADMPVVLTLAVKLPEKLDPDSLAQRFKAPAAGGKTRTVSILWRPHGNPATETELAVVWSEPADAAFLEGAFKGPNALTHQQICKQEVFASSTGLMQEMKSACSGSVPSLKNASPEVVKRLKAPASINLEVALGTLLATLVRDSWEVDSGNTASPPEINQAQKRLEELPAIALSGSVKDGAMVPGGAS